MKERIMNVVAWGTWINAIGWFLTPFVLVVWSLLEGLDPLMYWDDMLGCWIIASASLVIQWVLYYIITGSPRFLPWHYPSKMALQPIPPDTATS